MSTYVRNLGAPLALTCALLAGACKSDNKNNDSLAQDTSALNRDLQMAGRDTTAQPTLNDVPAPAAPAPAATRPATSAPRPTASRPTTSRPSTSTRPSNTTASGNTVTKNSGGNAGAAGGGAVGSVAAGTTINLASGQRVCTNTHKVGDTFSATVSEPVTGSNGVSIPAGATATVAITQLKRSENANDNVVMGLDVKSITYGGKTYPIDATTSYAKVDKVRNQPKGKDAQKVATGAAVGAILGQVIGKNTKGTVIGGAVGAAAGAGAAAATANYEGCIPQDGSIQIKLNGPVQVRA
ncbi:MAG: hypothetical protein ACJ79S_18610 [Gemmatimonadaceae bacterium]